MPIIISKDGNDTKRVEKTSFWEEKELQDYITENPDCIPKVIRMGYDSLQTSPGTSVNPKLQL